MKNHNTFSCFAEMLSVPMKREIRVQFRIFGAGKERNTDNMPDFKQIKQNFSDLKPSSLFGAVQFLSK